MKIAIYYTHQESLGHTNRTFRIAEGLAKGIRDSEIMIFQGGKPQDFMQLDSRIRLEKLPSPLTDRNWFWSVKGTKLKMEAIKERAKFIRKKLDEFRPDIFITEYFPFGRRAERFEINAALSHIKENHKDTKIIASLGYPCVNMPYTSVVNYLKCYDKVLVHSPKELDFEYIYNLNLPKIEGLAADEYRKLFDGIMEKIAFTGYVFSKKITKTAEEVKEELCIKDEKFVLISRGGGVLCPNVIYKGAVAARHLDDCKTVIVTGPSSNKKESAITRKLSEKSKSIKVVDYTPDLYNYMAACDVSISMSGYNTACEILSLKKKSILIPKYWYNNPFYIEQAYRAEILKRLIGSRVIKYDQLNAESLASEIRKSLEYPQNIGKIKEGWFDGIKNTAKEIKAIS